MRNPLLMDSWPPFVIRRHRTSAVRADASSLVHTSAAYHQQLVDMPLHRPGAPRHLQRRPYGCGVSTKALGESTEGSQLLTEAHPAEAKQTPAPARSPFSPPRRLLTVALFSSLPRASGGPTRSFAAASFPTSPNGLCNEVVTEVISRRFLCLNREKACCYDRFSPRSRRRMGALLRPAHLDNPARRGRGVAQVPGGRMSFGPFQAQLPMLALFQVPYHP